jgi:hypothetical protein
MSRELAVDLASLWLYPQLSAMPICGATRPRSWTAPGQDQSWKQRMSGSSKKPFVYGLTFFACLPSRQPSKIGWRR